MDVASLYNIACGASFGGFCRHADSPIIKDYVPIWGFIDYIELSFPDPIPETNRNKNSSE